MISSYKRFVSICLTAAALMACSGELDSPETGETGDSPDTGTVIPEEELLFTATLKDYVSDVKTLKPSWNKDEEINIFSGNDSGRFKLGAVLGEGPIATFLGKSVTASSYFALRPYDAEASCADGKISTVLPAEQNVTSAALPEKGCIAIAYTDKANLSFINISSIAGISTTNDNIVSMMISADGIAGKAVIDYNSADPAVSEGQRDTVTFNGSFTSGKTVWGAVWPGTYTSLTVIARRSDGRYAEKTVEGPVTFTASTLTDLGSFSFAEETFHYPGDIPEAERSKIFISGAGSEEGQELTYIYNELYYNTGNGDYLDIVDPINGKPYYEIFTQLTAGAPYWFQSADGHYYKGDTFEAVETAAAAEVTVNETAVYRLRIDIEGKKVYRSKVDQVTLFIATSQSHREMKYAGKGKWTIEGYNVKWVEASWGKEERYRFRIMLDGQAQPMGINTAITGGQPEKNTDPAYWNLIPAKTGQWTAMFKLPGWLLDDKVKNRWFCDVNLYLNNEKGHYTHEFVGEHEPPTEGLLYRNPLFTTFSIPDPDVIRADDGYFYSYSTEHDRNMCKNSPIMKSKDLIHWEKAGTLFTDATHPKITDENNPGIWAPSIHKIGNKYVCYYSQPGKNYKHAIGVATSDTPWGPFTDHGKLIDSNEQGVDISIDAYLYQEDGRNYLFWGSFRSISVLELTEDGLAIKNKGIQTRTEVAGGQYEASVVVKRDGWYYLIVSTGQYAKGGTYRIVVGRSRNLYGPYTDRQGRDMMSVHHELVLEGNGHFTSPGHCSSIITDDNGQDWILYHAYWEDPSAPNFRVLMIDRINWVDGWPVAPYTQSLPGGDILPYFKNN